MAGVKGRSGRRKSLDSLIKQSAYPVEVWQKFLGDRIHNNWDAIADEYIRRALGKSDVLLLDIVNRVAGKVKDNIDMGVHQELSADQIARLADQVRSTSCLPLNTATNHNIINVEAQVISDEMANNTASDSGEEFLT